MMATRSNLVVRLGRAAVHTSVNHLRAALASPLTSHEALDRLDSALG